MPNKPIVYIPNKGSHNYSDAERFGELTFLTSGRIRKYDIDFLYGEMSKGMIDAQEQDYVLISSLPIVGSIACSVMAKKFGKVNLLLFCDGAYIERTFVPT
jgi:hypothetical protein